MRCDGLTHVPLIKHRNSTTNNAEYNKRTLSVPTLNDGEKGRNKRGWCLILLTLKKSINQQKIGNIICSLFSQKGYQVYKEFSAIFSLIILANNNNIGTSLLHIPTLFLPV